MTKLDPIDRFNTIVKIAERSEKLGIGIGDRTTRILDIEFTDKQFNLRLEEFLNADDENFCHDFVAIQRHMNRRLGVIADLFVPRFAGIKE